MVDLLEGTELTPEQRDFVHTIRQSGDALLTLVDDVLDSSASDTRKPVVEAAEFDLRALIEGTASLCAEDAHRKGLMFGRAVDAKVPSFVSGDPVRLRLILDNLL